MEKIKNFKITTKALSIFTGVVIGFNVANYSVNPVKVCAENVNENSTKYEETSNIMIKSIARPTNPTNTLEYQEATEDNLLGDAANWNGFILGDVTNAVDFEGTIAIKGNLSANGLTVNSVANNVYHENTDDITLLVGGDININGSGSVWGSTATSNETVTNYQLSNVTESEQTTQGKYLVVDSTQYFTDAEKTLKDANKTIASKEANANYTNNGYGSYNFEGNSSEKELVYTVTENDFYNYNMNFNIDDDQTVVVNLVSDEDINFTNGSVSINGNKDDSYLRDNSGKITINVVNSSNVNVSSTAIYGNFIAPNSDMVGLNANICGTTVVNNLDGTGFEFHVSHPSSGQAVITPTPEVTQVPVTPTPEVTKVPSTPEVTQAPVTSTPAATKVPNTPEVTQVPVTPTPEVTNVPNIPEVTQAPVTPTPEVTNVPNIPEVTQVPVTPTPEVTKVPNTPEVTQVPVTPTPEVTQVPVTPTPMVTNVPVKPTVTKVPQQDIPKTADVTELVILRDLLLMAGSGFGLKKAFTKKKVRK